MADTPFMDVTIVPFPKTLTPFTKEEAPTEITLFGNGIPMGFPVTETEPPPDVTLVDMVPFTVTPPTVVELPTVVLVTETDVPTPLVETDPVIPVPLVSTEVLTPPIDESRERPNAEYRLGIGETTSNSRITKYDTRFLLVSFALFI